MTTTKNILFGCFLFVCLCACAPSFQYAGDQMRVPKLASDRAYMSDGTELRLKAWQAKEPGIILLGVHGFNDHAGAFEKAARWLQKQKVTTYAYDQRGFGSNKNRGIWADSDVLARDLRAMTSLIRKKHPLKPLYVVGLSMGGAVTIKAFAHNQKTHIEGLILVAPAVWGWKSMNPFYQGTLWLSAHTVPWYRATGEGLGKQASDNISMLKALGKDPLFIKKTRIDAVYGLVSLMDEAYGKAAQINLPSLYLYGAKDEIVPPEPSKKVMAKMRKPQHRKVIYKNGWHMLLRDKQAKIVWLDMLTWMTNKKAALPSGEEVSLKQLALRP